MTTTMKTVLIGLDDTDNLTSKGTGHLARLLARECRERGMEPLGTTRHQFPLDPRISYTSHNSGACVAVRTAHGPADASFAFDFVAGLAAEGSDPGVCILEAGNVPPAVIEFGKRVAREVVTMAEALELAKAHDVPLRGLGGTGLGVIGALGSAALRADGQEGRFIDMPGLRELPPRVTGGVFAAMGIRLEHTGSRSARPDDAYVTLDWIRPRLTAGCAVLPVEWSEEHNAWIPVDRKKSRPLE